MCFVHFVSLVTEVSLIYRDQEFTAATDQYKDTKHYDNKIKA